MICNNKNVRFCGTYSRDEEGEFKNDIFVITLDGGLYCLNLARARTQLCSSEGANGVVKVRGGQREPTSDYSFQFTKASPFPDLDDYYGEETSIDDLYPVTEEEDTGKIEVSRLK